MALSKFIATSSLAARLLRQRPSPLCAVATRSFCATAAPPEDFDTGNSADSSQNAENSDDSEALCLHAARVFDRMEEVIEKVNNTDSNSRKSEEVKALAMKAARVMGEMLERTKDEHPGIEFPNLSECEDFESLQRTVYQGLIDMKQKLKAGTTGSLEAYHQFSEVMYWHPFQVEGNERSYDLKEDDDNWCARVDLPGVGSKAVRVWFDKNYLYFKGEENDKDSLNGARKYSGKFCIPSSEYQINKISAVLNNGVLKIVIPKIKLEVVPEDVD